MSFSNWSPIAAENANVPGINWAEGMLPRDINNSARQMMADLAVRGLSLNGIDPTSKPYSADPTGATDSYTAFQNAINDALAQNRPFIMPAGRFKIGQTILMRPANYLSYAAAFTPGPRIFGSGSGMTVIDNAVSNGFLFDLDTPQNHATGFKAVLGTVFEGFSIIRTTATVLGSAISMRTTYNPRLRDLHVINQTGTGLRVPCLVGDYDSSNMPNISQVRIENCAGWGVDVGDPGHNENSFFVAEQLFIQGCGTAAITYTPTTGGMKYAGQILHLRNSAFTLNQNCALWIPGQAGLVVNVDLEGVDFENNYGKSVFCRGVGQFKGRNLQIYNNDMYTATNGMHFEFGSFVGYFIDIDGVNVRATSGNNAYTAFKVEGANTDRDSIRIRNIYWNNFDYTGQKRFEGVVFDQVDQNCALQVIDSGTISLRPIRGTGNSTPLKLCGPRNLTAGAAARSSTGEWIAHWVGASGVTALRATILDRQTGAAPVANTIYFVYLYEDTGQVKLGLHSGASPIQDTDPGVDLVGSEYMVCSADRTWLYVGTIKTDGASNFLTAGLGYLNPRIVFEGATRPGYPDYFWTDATGEVRVKVGSAGAPPNSDTDGVTIGSQV